MNKMMIYNRFVVDMPAEAAPLGFDPMLDTFSWADVYPANYWNRDELLSRIAVLGGNPVYTPAVIKIQAVIDPESKDPDLSPKLVLHFEENVPALVLNRTRCSILTHVTGTPNPRLWLEKIGKVELSLGVAREFSAAEQILITPIVRPASRPASRPTSRPTNQAVDDLNDDLFG